MHVANGDEPKHEAIVTLSKGTAWTIIGGIFAMGFAIGVALTSLQERVGTLESWQTSIVALAEHREERIRNLERDNKVVESRLEYFKTVLERIDNKLDRLSP